MYEPLKYACLVFFLLFPASFLHAQEWTEEDAGRLQQMLSGEKEIRLAPEFQKAIENGTFFSKYPDGTFLRDAPGHLPLATDFSEYIRPDSVGQIPLIDSLTPMVFMLMNFTPKRSWKIQKQAYTISSPFKEPKEKQIGILPLYVTGKVGAGNLFLSEVKDGQSRGSINATITVRLSVNDLLQLAFSKTARNKLRNRRRANTWKYYNDYP